ncbi:hypothetical protein B0H14DRAFT_2699955 [Mycena olivaceomarginata]|nr:hypothetical protein B0H14DRAFT_2699955 [Mycena olivaceomarginata]
MVHLSPFHLLLLIFPAFDFQPFTHHFFLSSAFLSSLLSSECFYSSELFLSLRLQAGCLNPCCGSLALDECSIH